MDFMHWRTGTECVLCKNVCVCMLVPLQVIQEEEERDQVGLRQRQQQVQHTALFGNTV